MRIKAINLSWFRGAADAAILEADAKSIVVYGPNGSGKSAFVDAVEYVLHDGKIAHLAHEYSGRHQEKAVPNTHIPDGSDTGLILKFKDDSELNVVVGRDGVPTISGAEAVAMKTWGYERTVLRQDEVARFIVRTKGEKYSALLPLLGLDALEVAAENLRQLSKTVAQQAKLESRRAALDQISQKCADVFGSLTHEEVLGKVDELHSTYCPGSVGNGDPTLRCAEVESAIQNQVNSLTAGHQRYLALKEIADFDFGGLVASVRRTTEKLASGAEPLVSEKLQVLQAAENYSRGLGSDQEQVTCPACGRDISVVDFRSHVRDEQQRLDDLRKLFVSRKSEVGNLCDDAAKIKAAFEKDSLKEWKEDLEAGDLADYVRFVSDLDLVKLRENCTEERLTNIEENLLPLAAAASSACASAPPQIEDLNRDSKLIQAAKEMVESGTESNLITGVDHLVAFIAALEQEVRNEIREQTEAIIQQLSNDIQAMWEVLHPGEAIEDVCLYIPEETDKAIDICVKFFGVSQDSPRLTLSEGHRNSLGLCIFLAMAKLDRDTDRPLFLDDVVVSLDRNHRGMIAELLERDFSGRQVFILTHDRDWYTELRHQLDQTKWIFKTLLPWESPEIGIRFSESCSAFDDARAQLADRPDSAGNDARKIMDVELAIITERLKLKMPFLRAHKNDMRMAHDFLVRLVKDGKKCFREKLDGEYKECQQYLDALKKADQLLESWGNRGSHSFDVVRPEAVRLIDECEAALQVFYCSSCNKSVWFADASTAEAMQCQCGSLQWRYGKA